MAWKAQCIKVATNDLDQLCWTGIRASWDLGLWANRNTSFMTFGSQPWKNILRIPNGACLFSLGHLHLMIFYRPYQQKWNHHLFFLAVMPFSKIPVCSTGTMQYSVWPEVYRLSLYWQYCMSSFEISASDNLHLGLLEDFSHFHWH